MEPGVLLSRASQLPIKAMKGLGAADDRHGSHWLVVLRKITTELD